MIVYLRATIPASAGTGEPIFELAEAARRRQGVTIVLPSGYKVDIDLEEVTAIDPFAHKEVLD